MNPFQLLMAPADVGGAAAAATPAAAPAPVAAPAAATPAAAPPAALTDAPAAVAEAPAPPGAITDADDGTKVDGEKKEGDDAPIEYVDFTLPEGSTLDPELRGKFTDILAKSGVSQDDAQSLVDLYGGEMKKLADAAKAPYEVWHKTRLEWQASVKADPELGGANYEPMKAEVAKVIDALSGDPKDAKELRQALAFTGAGNNPAVLRFLYRAAQAMNEGATVQGGGPTKEGTSAAKLMYPTMN